MDILQSEIDGKGKFYMEKDGRTVAEMTYVWAGDDRIIIDHTEVHESLKGTGAGLKLVLKAVEFARSKGIHIIPLCPFAKSVFDRKPELRDVL